ncbi:MAG: sigma-70 family RNA polymerase sigma factor [Dongiaceae bacterium]
MADQAQRDEFQRVMVPHLNDAFNLARWLTGNRSDAEDVVQEAFLKALKHFGTYRGPEARAWLLTIVRRCCFSWLRVNRSHQLVFTDDEAAIELANRATVIALHPKAIETPETLFNDKETKVLLNQAVEDLPLHYREVIVLREIQGLSYKEIAEIADIPVGTVMSRLARARDHLIKHLGGRIGSEASHGL